MPFPLQKKMHHAARRLFPARQTLRKSLLLTVPALLLAGGCQLIGDSAPSGAVPSRADAAVSAVNPLFFPADHGELLLLRGTDQYAVELESSCWCARYWMADDGTTLYGDVRRVTPEGTVFDGYLKITLPEPPKRLEESIVSHHRFQPASVSHATDEGGTIAAGQWQLLDTLGPAGEDTDTLTVLVAAPAGEEAEKHVFRAAYRLADRSLTLLSEMLPETDDDATR